MSIYNEIHLRRKPIADAMYELDKYLNDVFLAKLNAVKVIHGKGSGQMREAVWDVLAEHPLVRDYRLAYPGEGDAGVTIVYMENLEK